MQTLVEYLFIFNFRGSITRQGNSAVPVDLNSHHQPVMSDHNVFGDLTNLHNIGLKDRTTQRSCIRPEKSKPSQPGSCEQNPISFTKLLQSMGSQCSILDEQANFM